MSGLADKRKFASVIDSNFNKTSEPGCPGLVWQVIWRKRGLQTVGRITVIHPMIRLELACGMRPTLSVSWQILSVWRDLRLLVFQAVTNQLHSPGDVGKIWAIARDPSCPLVATSTAGRASRPGWPMHRQTRALQQQWGQSWLLHRWPVNQSMAFKGDRNLLWDLVRRVFMRICERVWAEINCPSLANTALLLFCLLSCRKESLIWVTLQAQIWKMTGSLSETKWSLLDNVHVKPTITATWSVPRNRLNSESP